MQITRYVLPVVVGSMGGMMLIILGENLIHNHYPLPPGTDLYDPDSLAKAMKLMPGVVFQLLLVNYIVASFFAGLVSSLIARRETSRPAIVVGIVLTLAGLYNVVALPHPGWFGVVSLLVYLPFAYLGYILVRKKSRVSVP